MGKTISSGQSPGYKAPAIQKALHILHTVADSRQGLGLTDLAIQLGFSKSTTHGLVHALLREGALAQGPDGRKLYIGPTIVDLAFSSWNYLRMARAVQPVLDDLRDQIKETLVLGALVCNRILIIATSESINPLKISTTPGNILPLFAGAAGKVLLSAKSTEMVQQLIREKGLPRHTPCSIVDESVYLQDLEKIRQKGYCVDDEEYLTGVRAVAAALQNIKGPPMAVWAVGLSSSMEDEKVADTINVIMAAVENLRTTLYDQSGY